MQTLTVPTSLLTKTLTNLIMKWKMLSFLSRVNHLLKPEFPNTQLLQKIHKRNHICPALEWPISAPLSLSHSQCERNFTGKWFRGSALTWQMVLALSLSLSLTGSIFFGNQCLAFLFFFHSTLLLKGAKKVLDTSSHSLVVKLTGKEPMNQKTPTLGVHNGQIYIVDTRLSGCARNEWR